jgi:acyl-CoA thioester hydrolase
MRNETETETETGSGSGSKKFPEADAAQPPDGFVHECSVRVRYADVDQMGVAYHAHYLRWFEVGRSEMFRSLGLPYREVEQRGVLMPVSEVFCKFVSGARYDEQLTIETRLDPAVRGGMKFDYRIFAGDRKQLVARGYTRHAFVDAGGKVVRPPAFLTEVLATAKTRKEAVG